MNVVLQGDLMTGDNRVLTARVRRAVSTNTLRIKLDSDCTVTLSKFQDLSKTTKEIWKFDLEAGDVLTDTSGYILEANDYLTVNISAGTGTWHIQGLEIQVAV